MKLNFSIIIFFLLIITNTFAENIKIQANKVSLDNDKKISVFKEKVVITTKEKIIKGDYVKYDKINGFLIIKNNVVATDFKNNTVKTDYAE